MSQVTAFLDDRIVASGERDEVTRLIEARHAADCAAIRVFENEGGRIVDLDYRNSSPALAGEGDHPKGGGGDSSAPASRPRGRPKLGVTAREITLLPRHWEWLAGQPGGASAALRRLVEEARRAPPDPKAARDAAYRFMQAMCGDRPGYEEALRALYRGEMERFRDLTAAWPEDVRAYLGRLLARR
jgi:uncharacterized protein